MNVTVPHSSHEPQVTSDAGLSPRRLFRVFAIAEVITWTLLILGMLLKYVFEVTELGVRLGGGLHGFVFLSYCLTTVLVGTDARWGAGRILLGLGSAVIPYLTIPFERWVDRAGLLLSTWRLRDEEPQNIMEKLVGFAVRKPLFAALIALVVVALVFTALLAAGPPTQWFS